jgi:cyclophilin family peptidyl-prolyl cis-trans isomerase
MSTDHQQQEQQERHRHEEAMVQCETTKGPIVMRFYRNWAPNGYDRVVELFERHFFDESHFFRVLPSNLVQFGISYSDDKELQDWARSTIVDDPRRDDIAFDKSIISFAGNGPHSRSSQLFIAYAANEHLGREVWEIPVGKVIDGMDNADAFYSYGDSPPWGSGKLSRCFFR